tara:strand:+ start:3429 stop:3806 length:378 start_codon:yes stop_codon:yes gene_type:complete
MNPKFILVITFIYITLAFLGSTYELATTAGGDWAGNVEGEEVLDPLYNVRNIETQSESWGILGAIPLPGEGFWSSIFKITLLRFSFLIPDYEMIWMIVLLPISVAGLISVALIGGRIWEAVTPFS